MATSAPSTRSLRALQWGSLCSRRLLDCRFPQGAAIASLLLSMEPAARAQLRTALVSLQRTSSEAVLLPGFAPARQLLAAAEDKWLMASVTVNTGDELDLERTLCVRLAAEPVEQQLHCADVAFARLLDQRDEHVQQRILEVDAAL